MKWLKDVVLDIAITVFIVLATTGMVSWAQWVVFIYTPFMLAIKALAFFGGGVGQVSRQRKKADDAPPALFFHALYAINVTLLALNTWWISAGQWALIWLFSFLVERRGG
ncbi:MAG: hypothetical protein R2834_18375 [Rhodothermales bacterium]